MNVSFSLLRRVSMEHLRLKSVSFDIQVTDCRFRWRFLPSFCSLLFPLRRSSENVTANQDSLCSLVTCLYFPPSHADSTWWKRTCLRMCPVNGSKKSRKGSRVMLGNFCHYNQSLRLVSERIFDATELVYLFWSLMSQLFCSFLSL